MDDNKQPVKRTLPRRAAILTEGEWDDVRRQQSVREAAIQAVKDQELAAKLARKRTR